MSIFLFEPTRTTLSKFSIAVRIEAASLTEAWEVVKTRHEDGDEDFLNPEGTMYEEARERSPTEIPLHILQRPQAFTRP